MSTTATPRLALVGDHGNHDEPSHPRLDAMTPHWDVATQWVPTSDISDPAIFDGYDGIWVVPGAPYVNQKGVHLAVRHARETARPFLGTCGGFYSALIEHAQNVLHLPEAIGIEDDPERIATLVTPLSCAFHGEKAPLSVREGSLISRIYGGATAAEEVFHCNYGLTEEFMGRASQGDLSISAWDTEGAPRALEIGNHPFFLGSLFQPELSSTPHSPHPIITAFLAAVRRSAGARALAPSA